MNKILLSVATTIAVVGGTALAASTTNMVKQVTTTTYKPGTPNYMAYPGSPDEVGQSTSTSGTRTSQNVTKTDNTGQNTASAGTHTQPSAPNPAPKGIWNVDLVGLPGNQGTDYTLSFGTGGLPGAGMILQQGIATQHQAMADMWSWHYRTGLPIAGTGISGNQAATDLSQVGVTFQPAS